jgi:hypothetical protein
LNADANQYYLIVERSDLSADLGRTKGRFIWDDFGKWGLISIDDLEEDLHELQEIWLRWDLLVH